MKFNEHSQLKGQHAFLSASGYHWINYDLEKLFERYTNSLAVQKGSEIHDLAAKLIEHGIDLPKRKQTLNQYVNDAIGYLMTPEQPLYYSPNCFGTADAIAFRDNFLRIHDLKTGSIEASIHQLEIYAALFCLEYRYDPEKLDGIELRIYQNNQVRISNPEPELIRALMNKIVEFDMELEKFKQRS